MKPDGIVRDMMEGDIFVIIIVLTSSVNPETGVPTQLSSFAVMMLLTMQV